MGFLFFVVWSAVVAVVGVSSARDIKQEKVDHDTAAILATQTVGDRRD